MSQSPFLVRLCLPDPLRIPFQLPTLDHDDDDDNDYDDDRAEKKTIIEG